MMEIYNERGLNGRKQEIYNKFAIKRELHERKGCSRAKNEEKTRENEGKG